MASDADLRDEFLRTLTHISGAFSRSRAASGPTQPLQAPDLHKLSEGLFLSAWTHWEAFCRALFIDDLATDSSGVLGRDVSRFRYKGSAWRLAYALLDHPDPSRFIEWSEYSKVRERADSLLGAGHRFVPLPRDGDIAFMKRIRNAIAHRSDRAWESFINLTKSPPFSLGSRQRMGITPGRFISTALWQGVPVLREAVSVLDESARVLVP